MIDSNEYPRIGRTATPFTMSFPFRIGLFSIGLSAYWEQFPGLRERLLSYNQQIEEKLSGMRADVIDLGMIDSPEKGLEAGHSLRQSDVALVFIHAATYALSSTALPAVRLANVPVVVLNLSPQAAIDYEAFNRMNGRREMTGEWLAHCGACPVPELANLFRRGGIRFEQVTGVLDAEDPAWNEIREWVDAAHVAHKIRHSRLGLMGHYYSGMLDIATDITNICIVFGSHIELLEVDELSALRQAVMDEEIEHELALFAQAFDVQADCDPGELRRAARTAKALDRFVDTHDLHSLAYYYKGTGNEANEDTISSIILGTSLLTARNIPVAGEYEVKNALAMKILDSFEAGGSFTEYYAVDFTADTILMGHDGPGHLAIADGKTKVRPLEVFHGKVGKGVSIEMSVKQGPVTLLSLTEEGRSYKFLIAEGESVAGEILKIGNTNSHYRFPLGARGFIQEWNRHGPTHHCAVGVGHIASKLKKLATLFGLEAVQVC